MPNPHIFAADYDPRRDIISIPTTNPRLLAMGITHHSAYYSGGPHKRKWRESELENVFSITSDHYHRIMNGDDMSDVDIHSNKKKK